MSTSSPSPSDAPSSSFRDTPFTIDLPAISPAPINSGNLVEDEDNISDLSTGDSLQSYEEMPVLSTAAVGSSSSFRRHSFAETSTTTATTTTTTATRVIGQKVKRESTDDDYVDANLNEMFGDEHSSPLTTGPTPPPPSSGVNDASRYVVHMSKRRRSINEVTSASAPALFPIPLPNVDLADNGSPNQEGGQEEFLNISPRSVSTTPAINTQRRNNNLNGGSRRRTTTGATNAKRSKRTPCDFCGKTFTRVQDAQRHMTTSCAASPEKVGVECPQCNSVLSRLDAAQRHWRGHENPTCPTPSWMIPSRP
jgi:hypothetical protein